ncbi:MAG TPA: hypothetical protein VNC78_12550 [Actinomycetota bacterium]|nr:hypothetical protein [Actinomycetota bacterium]
MRKTVLLSICGALVALSAAPAGAAAPKPVVVFEDAAGDAGVAANPAPGLDQLGVDLTGGSIARNGNNLEFTVTHATMPPVGSMPEVGRLMWHFSVGKEQWRFTVKSFDIGKPDAIAGSGTERAGQVYTAGAYRLEQCVEAPGVGVTLVNCNVIEYLEGSFDPAAKSFTVILPMASVKAKTGSIIAGGTSGAANTGCQICWVPHIAERSLTDTTIIDAAAQTVTYKIPK